MLPVMNSLYGVGGGSSRESLDDVRREQVVSAKRVQENKAQVHAHTRTHTCSHKTRLEPWVPAERRADKRPFAPWSFPRLSKRVRAGEGGVGSGREQAWEVREWERQCAVQQGACVRGSGCKSAGDDHWPLLGERTGVCVCGVVSQAERDGRVWAGVLLAGEVRKQILGPWERRA